MTIHTSTRRLRPFLTAAALVFGLGALPAVAQSAPEADPGRVIAKVGGQEITEAELGYAFEDSRQVLQNMQPAQRLEYLINELVNVKLMAQAAREANLQDSETYARRKQYLEDRALYRAYFNDRINANVTDEKVQAAYDEFAAGFEPEEEIRARHILVETEEEMEQVQQQLADGEPFEMVALEHSIDTGSAQNGGDLGFFSRGRMVPAFEEAAFALEPGEMSEPVESQFGWHIIKLEEERMSSAPPLEQMQGQLRQQLLAEEFNAAMEQISEGVEIEIVDEQLRQVYSPNEGGNAEGAAEEE